ncbi:hypothetical protein [Cellulomonas biazotea]|uniref:Uncharacterized protein n=1 Tax=Cellulomonas biazotea TaxID=1709 RepID=A0A402DTQ9_9CELL|nr:hypothetical protein [Cellulomonas biazotea]GCE77540.1 hypothetical protein CBZ_25960 [Cellulomonas biazotea]
MSVSLQYVAERTMPLAPHEEVLVARVVDEWNAALRLSAPRLSFDAPPLPPAVVLRGTTALPPHPFHALASLVHWCGALTELRRALPDAWWSVRVDGDDIPWEDGRGYALPGMDDPELLAALPR